MVSLIKFPSCLGQGPPIFADTPILLGLEGRGIRSFFEIAETKSGQSSKIIFAAPYNFTRNLQFGLVVPLVFHNPKLLQKRNGLGDGAIFLKYVIHQRDFHKKTLRTLIRITEVFPTGDELPEPALGTGDFQTHLSIVTALVSTQWGIYLDMGYTVFSKFISNRFLHNIALVLPVLPQKYPPRQVNLSFAFNGKYDLDDPYNELLISPGIQFIPGKKVLFETGVKLPVSDKLNSMDYKYIINFGGRVLLF